MEKQKVNGFINGYNKSGGDVGRLDYNDFVDLSNIFFLLKL
jgi:hypothetical protein